jgi:hypothetical protein
MRRVILPALILRAGVAYGAIEHIPIKSNLVLNPGHAYTISLQATEATEIGWKAVQPKPCTTKCVQATDLTGGISYSIATALGASMKYTPAAGTISVEYKNVSTEPVTINVYRVKRTCESEACKFFDPNDKGRWLVFKIDEFTSISTSSDGSYSVISGVATSGRQFRFKAVWWTEDKNAIGVNCSPFVKGYLDRHTPKDQYRPYVISGRAVGPAGDDTAIVLKSVDTCAPKAPNFGAPDSAIFK